MKRKLSVRTVSLNSFLSPVTCSAQPSQSGVVVAAYNLLGTLRTSALASFCHCAYFLHASDGFPMSYGHSRFLSTRRLFWRARCFLCCFRYFVYSLFRCSIWCFIGTRVCHNVTKQNRSCPYPWICFQLTQDLWDYWAWGPQRASLDLSTDWKI